MRIRPIGELWQDEVNGVIFRGCRHCGRDLVLNDEWKCLLCSRPALVPHHVSDEDIELHPSERISVIEVQR